MDGSIYREKLNYDASENTGEQISDNDMTLSLLNEEQAFIQGPVPTFPGKNLYESELSQIRENYRKAIEKKRSYVLPEENFINHATYHSQYFKLGDSYVFGSEIEEPSFFIPSHFAPASNKEGLLMLKSIAKYENVLLCVMGDMVNMLKKLGFYDTGITVPQYFGHEQVQKHVVVSNIEYLKLYQHDLIQYFIDDGYIQEEDCVKRAKNTKTDNGVYQQVYEDTGIDYSQLSSEIDDFMEKYNLEENMF